MIRIFKGIVKKTDSVQSLWKWGYEVIIEDAIVRTAGISIMMMVMYIYSTPNRVVWVEWSDVVT